MLSRVAISASNPAKSWLKLSASRRRPKARTKKPTPILMGYPMIKTFICGMVLAINPMIRSLKRRAAMAGAPNFKAITKTSFIEPTKWGKREELKVASPRGIILRLE